MEETNERVSAEELYHHGVIGMKWGVRRYQPYGVGYDPENKGRNVGEAAKAANAAGRLVDTIAKKRKKKAQERAEEREYRKTEREKDREFRRSEKAKDDAMKRQVKAVEAERRRQEWAKERLKQDQFKQQEREKAREDKRHDKVVKNEAKRREDNLKDEMKNKKRLEEISKSDVKKAQKEAEREAKKQAKQEERAAEKAAKKTEQKAKNASETQKQASQMTTEELRAAAARLQAENNYNRELATKLQNDKAKKDAGKSFMKKMVSNMGKKAMDAAINAGTQYVTKLVNDKIAEYTTPQTVKDMNRWKKETEYYNAKNSWTEAKKKYEGGVSDAYDDMNKMTKQINTQLAYDKASENYYELLKKKHMFK